MRQLRRVHVPHRQQPRTWKDVADDDAIRTVRLDGELRGSHKDDAQEHGDSGHGRLIRKTECGVRN